MARDLSADEQRALARAQRTLNHAEEALAVKVRDARRVRDGEVARLLHFGVAAPVIARELGVTRAAVYEMAKRARVEADRADP